MTEKKFKMDKAFIKILLMLVIPITLQNLISNSLNMIDNLMIGELGENAIAAVGLVNQYFFIFMLTLSGVNAGTSIFISQYWGTNDKNSIYKVIGIGLITSIITSIIFTIFGLLIPEKIIGFFTDNQTVISLGVEYLKVISLTFILTGIGLNFSTALRCVNEANPPMFASLIGVFVNAFLNWVLIFGNLGAPVLGVKGAAIATAIARLVEFLIIMFYMKKLSKNLSLDWSKIFNINRLLVSTFFKTSTAVIVNEILWAIGNTLYSYIYAKVGIKAVASMQIATTVNNLFMVLSLGLANAAAIIVGNQIGADKEDKAIEYAMKLGALAPIVGIFIGGLLWLASPNIVGIFNIDSDTALTTINVIKIMAIFAPLRFFNLLMIVGVFRGGGDTLYSMLVQLGTVFCYAIPFGYVAAKLNWSLEYVFLIIISEELIKILFEFSRLRSRKWIKKVA